MVVYHTSGLVVESIGRLPRFLGAGHRAIRVHLQYSADFFELLLGLLAILVGSDRVGGIVVRRALVTDRSVADGNYVNETGVRFPEQMVGQYHGMG